MNIKKGYRSLHAWEKAFKLSIKIYKVTKIFPNEEKFGLSNQLRRASISIPSNIAEGYGRQTPKSFLNFARISLGSLNEVETQILISKELGYIDTEVLKSILSEIGRLQQILQGLIRKLRQKSDTNTNSENPNY